MYGEGDPAAALMVVGEGPGETEDAMGRPFVGRAGQLLDRMLAAIGLAREDVYICNTVKCRPTLAAPNGLRNRAPEPEEMANCRPFLDEQIEIIAPRVLLALGAPAAKSFLGRDFQITKMRGRWYAGPLGIPLMVTFHPAYILRQTGGEIEAVKRLVWHDLKEVRGKTRRTGGSRSAHGTGGGGRTAAGRTLRGTVVSRDPMAMWSERLAARAGFSGRARRSRSISR